MPQVPINTEIDEQLEERKNKLIALTYDLYKKRLDIIKRVAMMKMTRTVKNDDAERIAYLKQKLNKE